MKKTADDYYLFIIPLKYSLKEFNRKSIKQLIILSILIYIIVSIYVVQNDNIPITFLFKVVALFLASSNIFGLFLLLCKKWKYNEAMLWSSICAILMQYAYVIIVFVYTTFLSKFSFIVKNPIYFDAFLCLPLLVSVSFLIKYFYQVNKNEAHKLSKKAIQLDRKYKGEKIAIEKKKSSKRSLILMGTLIGAGTTSIVERSFSIFLCFLVCVFFVSIAVSRMIMVTYMKFKFPNDYLYENIETRMTSGQKKL